ncbi:MAG: cob(I)yrinic acid a,c-diamide adenosyltransferase [Candidatus Marinimicrobia bacterium]|nr:cob(I)yrinic acid a,c-diamide adenosyltransferase [Candidatus Neomarinimicrobiota bacterium]
MSDKKTASSNIRINKVYTKTGDKGKTRIVGGEKRSKDDPRVEAYGSVDELNSHLGLCRDLLIKHNRDEFKELIQFLKIVQNELFDLGTQLACSDGELNSSLPKIKEKSIKELESEIDSANSDLGELKSFVLPGGSILNSQFHIARSICRRAERRAVTLANIESVEAINIIYLNRLSDALFVWSRWISHILNDNENLWEPTH